MKEQNRNRILERITMATILILDARKELWHIDERYRDEARISADLEREINRIGIVIEELNRINEQVKSLS